MGRIVETLVLATSLWAAGWNWGCNSSSGGGGGSPPGSEATSTIHEGHGWRTVTSFGQPERSEATFWDLDIAPSQVFWYGAIGGHGHLGWTVLAKKAFDPGWVEFDLVHDAHPVIHGSELIYPPAQLIGDTTHYYAWQAQCIGPGCKRTALRRISTSDGADVTEIFNGSANYPSAPGANVLDGTINGALDVLATGTLGSGGVLYAKRHDATTGYTYFPNGLEMRLEHDLDGSYLERGGSYGYFNPEDGHPYKFELATFGVALGPPDASRGHFLHVYVPTEDVHPEGGSNRVLRRIRRYPADDFIGHTDDLDVHVVIGGNQAWVRVANLTAKTWRIYRFDRATEELVLDQSLAAPPEVDPSKGVVLSEVASYDGALYLLVKRLALSGTDRRFAVLKVFKGAVTQLWEDSFAVHGTPADLADFVHVYDFPLLFSTGDRIFGIVAHAEIVDLLPKGGDPIPFNRPRYSVITPDVESVPAPPAPPPPGVFTAPPGCTPKTNAGCKTGEACDSGPSTTGHTCQAAGTGGLCAACNPTLGPQCQAGYQCRATAANKDPASGQCLRFCCTNADCGGFNCEHYAPYSLGVGVCTVVNGSTGALLPQCTGLPTIPASGAACAG